MNTRALVLKALTVRGSVSGSQQNLEELYELMSSGELSAPLQRISPMEIPEGLERLRAGGLVGRLIAVYED